MASKSEHSRSEYLMLEAVRQFKEGQLYAWVNDEQTSEAKFEKCLRAIRHAEERESRQELKALEDRARQEPRKKDIRSNAVRARDNRLIDGRRLPLTYTVVPLASNRMEFRALIHLPWKQLREIAHAYILDQTTRNIVTDRTWQWIQVDQEVGFTATFHLTYADGTLFGQILTHSFLDEAQELRLRHYLPEFVTHKLRIA